LLRWLAGVALSWLLLLPALLQPQGIQVQLAASQQSALQQQQQVRVVGSGAMPPCGGRDAAALARCDNRRPPLATARTRDQLPVHAPPTRRLAATNNGATATADKPMGSEPVPTVKIDNMSDSFATKVRACVCVPLRVLWQVQQPVSRRLTTTRGNPEDGLQLGVRCEPGTGCRCPAHHTHVAD
jgi:hypothetical protein